MASILYEVSDRKYHVANAVGYNTSKKKTKLTFMHKLLNATGYVPVFGAITAIERYREGRSALKKKKIVIFEIVQEEKTLKNRSRAHKVRAVFEFALLGVIFLIPDIVVTAANAVKKRRVSKVGRSDKKDLIVESL